MPPQYASLDQFSKLLVKELRDQCMTCQITMRAALKEAIEPLFDFDLFRRPVIEDFRELYDIYPNFISLPVSLNEINDRLHTRQDIVPFYYVGDCFTQLVLVATNCRFFNRETPSILEICQQYEAKLLTAVNEFCKKAEKHQLKAFRQFSELKEVIFYYFHPGRVPGILPKKQNKARSPYLEEVIALVKKLQALPSERQTILIGGMLREMDDIKFSGSGILLSEKVDVDFLTMKPGFFWWFWDAVQENFAIQYSADQEREMMKQIQNQMIQDEVLKETAFVSYLEQQKIVIAQENALVDGVNEV
ncbi:Bromodomain containing protein [Spironucleus salmonicida]|uniref:Bromodomain containing protein n=1 Tax=Spironucleus salmonicida TaxID=348837 RepID=V6LV56_9EUKA|nr:Bromodomain containing protein [Spironucleus salmonicida]|eukprot:EST48522.1 Bromodomain containing protein [Spironucleus salmonicida]